MCEYHFILEINFVGQNVDSALQHAHCDLLLILFNKHHTSMFAYVIIFFKWHYVLPHANPIT